MYVCMYVCMYCNLSKLSGRYLQYFNINIVAFVFNGSHSWSVFTNFSSTCLVLISILCCQWDYDHETGLLKTRSKASKQ